MTIWSFTGVSRKKSLWIAIIAAILSLAIISGNTWASETASDVAHEFPLSLDSYGDDNLDGIGAKMKNRIGIEPFNLAALLIFLCAITHTFMASKFTSMSNKRRQTQAEKIRTGEAR